jgi:hypothetical protein
MSLNRGGNQRGLPWATLVRWAAGTALHSTQSMAQQREKLAQLAGKLFLFKKPIAHFQNSYLSNFKPKSFQTSPKTFLSSCSIYSKYFLYYVLY